MILKTQGRKKPNNPFKRLLKQCIILCTFKNSKVWQDNSESTSQLKFREDNISEYMVEMLEHVQQLDNEEMPDACDVED